MFPTSRSPRVSTVCRTTLAALLGAASLAALAADPAAGKSRYEQDRARCMSGQSGQALDTCLREAGAVKQQGPSQLTDGAGKLGPDAKQRCDALAGSERRDCLARVDGAANTSSSGSVKSGGVLRESVTTVPAASAPASGAR